jgi:predicted metal-dependent HD superfamily phosphohydrolase
MNIDILKYNWQKLLEPFLVELSVSKRIFGELVSAYSSVGRFYHTLQHIHYVLDTLEGMELVALDFSVIQLAAWFHDVIYDPKYQDNEEKSAEYAEVALTELSIPLATIARVKTLILSTKTHQSPPDDIDCQILLDGDLAILGAVESEYKAYSMAIRQEYSWVPEREYRWRRKQVLDKFLQRNRIYYTSELFLALEERARHNLQGEIRDLGGSISIFT